PDVPRSSARIPPGTRPGVGRCRRTRARACGATSRATLVTFVFDTGAPRTPVSPAALAAPPGAAHVTACRLAPWFPRAGAQDGRRAGRRADLRGLGASRRGRALDREPSRP